MSICYHAPIWRLLKRRGPMPVRGIAAALNHCPKRVPAILARMATKGCVRRIGGYTHLSLWEAMGDTIPRNMTGYAAAQQANLVPRMRQWRQLLDRANVARGVPHARPTYPQPDCELARCWPASPASQPSAG